MREAMGIPEDAFVVGMVAANKGTGRPARRSRKCSKRSPGSAPSTEDAFLYLHWRCQASTTVSICGR